MRVWDILPTARAEAVFVSTLPTGGRVTITDERVAVLLEEFSTIARGSSGYAAAAAALERAAMVSPVGQARRLHLAAADAQLAGDEQLARTLLARADAAAGRSMAVPSAPGRDLDLAARLLRDGQPSDAGEILGAVLRGLRSVGAVRAMPAVLALLAEAQVMAGLLGAAESTARTAAALAGLTADDSAFAATCTLALVDALRGEAERSRSHYRRAVELAAGDATRLARAQATQIVLDLGAGRFETVMSRRSGTDSIEAVPDLLEATVRAGHHLAPGDVDALRELGRSAPAPIAAGAWRVLGLIAGPDHFRSYLERSLELHARMDLPFQHGRVQLMLGELLRRAGQRVTARGHLSEAQSTFARIGAGPWEERAAREYNLTRGRGRAAHCPLRSALTRQEFEVARAVAAGLTNRQAATQLFVSVKTVEFHLGNVFRKLDVNNRTQLARRITPPM